MSSRAAVADSKETPMEHIFYKVTGRRMTAREKALFHLNGDSKPSPRNGSRTAGSHRNTQRN